MSQSRQEVARSGFTTSGLISFSDLGTRSGQLSVDFLTRLAAAGVHPFTVITAQALAQNFSLCARGRSNVRTALDRTTGTASWGKVLWFGFGVKSIVYDLAQTDEGYWVLAICGLLAECYHEDFAAEVLQELVQALKRPDQLGPSTNEWCKVVKTCAGIFATSVFPLFYGKLVQLSISRLEPERLPLRSIPQKRPKAKDLAKVLIALGKVSKGHLYNIEVHAGVNGAWIVALADWIFGLRTCLVADDGTVLWSNCPSTTNLQVRVSLCGSHTKTGSLSVHSSTLFLKDAFAGIHISTPARLVATGRWPWSTCLSVAFPKHFELLVAHRDLLEAIIGIIATVSDALHSVNKAFFSTCGKDWKGLLHEPVPSGEQFLSVLRGLFPELQLVIDLDKIHVHNIADAIEQYDDIRLELKEQLESKYENDECRIDYLDLQQFISNLVLVSCLMFNTEIQENLCPRIDGLQMVLADGFSSICDGMPDNHSPISPLCYMISAIAMSAIPHVKMCYTMCLFTGRKYLLDISRDGQYFDAAVCETGICAYLGILKELTLECEKTSRLYVSAGRMEQNGRPFYSVVESSEVMDWPRTMRDDPPPIATCLLSARETVNSLQLGWVLEHVDGSCYTIGRLSEFIAISMRAAWLGRRCGRECPALVARLDPIKTRRTRCVELPVLGDLTRFLQRRPTSHDSTASLVARSNEPLTLATYIFQDDEIGNCRTLYNEATMGAVATVLKGGACVQCCLGAVLEELAIDLSPVSPDDARAAIVWPGVWQP